MKYGFIIDNRKCIGCHACTVACKAEHDVPVGVNRTWVKYIEKGAFPNTKRLFSVMRCNHCEDAPCVDICPTSALYKKSDGIVDFDNRRCIGCKACTQACPYDAIYIDPETHTAAKCNYCSHRTEIGLEPACVNVCPEHAIISGDMDDPDSEISTLLHEQDVSVRKPEKGTKPQLFYIDGDQSSLVPTEAKQSLETLWGSQAAGVGHFADSAQETDESDQSGSAEHNAAPEHVLIPRTGDIEKLTDKARDVEEEQAKQVYDAPTKGAVWGWEVPAYLWTKSIAAGLFIVSVTLSFFKPESISVTVQRQSVIVALIFLGLTGMFLVKDLDKPSRFLYVLLRPNWTSWLAKGAYIIMGYSFAALLWLIGSYFQIDIITRIAAWGGIPLAVLTAIYTAFLFGQAKGRDFWQSPSLWLHMLIHAIIAGAALFSFILYSQATLAENMVILKLILAASIAINLILFMTDLFAAHRTADTALTVKTITKGRFKNMLIYGVIFAGNLLPLVFIFTGVNVIFLAGNVLLLAGLFAAEHIWVKAPQLIPLS